MRFGVDRQDSGGYTTLGSLKPPTQYPCLRTDFTAAVAWALSWFLQTPPDLPVK
jgi:hypothetical protein